MNSPTSHLVRSIPDALSFHDFLQQQVDTFRNFERVLRLQVDSASSTGARCDRRDVAEVDEYLAEFDPGVVQLGGGKNKAFHVGCPFWLGCCPLAMRMASASP